MARTHNAWPQTPAAIRLTSARPLREAPVWRVATPLNRLMLLLTRPIFRWRRIPRENVGALDIDGSLRNAQGFLSP